MSDEPMTTRWSFQDFKLFWDAKFGRKKLTEQENGKAGDAAVSGVVSNEKVDVDNSSELAIYEQFRNQEQNSIHCNGISLNHTHDIPCAEAIRLPTFESAEMRAIERVNGWY